MTHRRIPLFALACVVALAGCASSPTSVATDPAPTTASAPAATSEDVLATLGVEGMSATEAVEHLDQSDATRPQSYRGSVTGTQVILGTSEANTVSLPIPDDQFYLSLAPYETRTHDCYNHSLATCQGELVGENVHVTITADDGTVLVDEDATTYANGFVGFWLPRNIGATVEVTAAGGTGSTPIRTDDDSPTCLTTIQLS